MSTRAIICTTMAVLVATSVHADTIQYSHDYGFLAVDVDLDAQRRFVAFPADTWDAQIDQFDSSLGSLVGIAFDFNLNFEIGGMTNNDDPGDSRTGGGMGAGGSFFYNSTAGRLQNQAGNGVSAGSTEANTAFSETTLVTATWALEDSMDASAWSDLAQAVTGSGSWTFMWNAVMEGSFGTYNPNDPGTPYDVSGLDLDSLYAQLNSGSITVTYDYEANSNPVPGPAAVMAVAAIGLVRRRSRG